VLPIDESDRNSASKRVGGRGAGTVCLSIEQQPSLRGGQGEKLIVAPPDPEG